MRQRAARAASILCIVIAIGIVALWVRSYFVEDGLDMRRSGRRLHAYASAGSIVLVWQHGLPPSRPEAARTRGEKPEPVTGGYGRALVSFHAGLLPWGNATVVWFAHWAVAAMVATWPAVRFIRCRCRPAACFAVEPQAGTAGRADAP